MTSYNRGNSRANWRRASSDRFVGVAGFHTEFVVAHADAIGQQGTVVGRHRYHFRLAKPQAADMPERAEVVAC